MKKLCLLFIPSIALLFPFFIGPNAGAGKTNIAFKVDGAQIDMREGGGVSLSGPCCVRGGVLLGRKEFRFADIRVDRTRPMPEIIAQLEGLQTQGRIEQLQITQIDEAAEQQFLSLLDETYQKLEICKDWAKKCTLLRGVLWNFKNLAQRVGPLAPPPFIGLQRDYAVALANHAQIAPSQDRSMLEEPTGLLFHLHQEVSLLPNISPHIKKDINKQLCIVLFNYSSFFLKALVEKTPDGTLSSEDELIHLTTLAETLKLYPLDGLPCPDLREGFPESGSENTQGSAPAGPSFSANHSHLIACIQESVADALLWMGSVQASIEAYQQINNPLPLEGIDEYLEILKAGINNPQRDQALAKTLKATRDRARKMGFVPLMHELFPQNPWEKVLAK